MLLILNPRRQFFCFSYLEEEIELEKYQLVRFIDEESPKACYRVVPKAWIINIYETMYPRSEGGACALEELVREGMPPMPKKKFKKVAIKLVYGLGNTFSFT